MRSLTIRSATEQTSDFLREEILRGTWTETMPGRNALVKQLSAGGDTVQAALEQLEREGLLESQGAGRRRRIVLPNKHRRTALQVKMILYERDDSSHRLILELRRQLEAAGHGLSFASKTLKDLKQDPRKVAKWVRADPSDVWIVNGGSKPVLEWFAQAVVPAFALFGSMTGLSIAGTGPDKLPALREALLCLKRRGDRRIVMLVREEVRKAKHGLFLQTFFDALKDRGITPGAYNLPDWEESPKGLSACLDAIFKVTPPTAIIVEDPVLCLAVRNYLAEKRGAALRQVALICADQDPSLFWCWPAIPHMRFDHQPVIRHVVRWVNGVARGKENQRQKLFPAKLVGHDSIAPLAVKA
ncbi:hypothetical protein DDZ13_02950 [Coraliomargarita sinensis]|uniref:Uncharacterized protein n=1 Tax=Coraliomargarita sinensis TaxID=2174842 RepID=A0A317ZMA5_9BACT|nr:GntR family transcriptional regulator [Coraliomargarita sinensis]PXA04939.1 hypothetical protein DDZ13_02950 [Coraliomargarita sinensis]